MKKFQRSISAAVLACAATSVPAHGVTTGPLTIEHPFALPTPPGATTGGAYLQDIGNAGKDADRLIGATSPAADRVELHSMQMDGDVMRMRKVSSITVEPGGHVQMRPGNGYHLMMTGLRKPLAIGDEIPLTLQFERAGRIDVMLHVQERGASSTTKDHDSPR